MNESIINSSYIPNFYIPALTFFFITLVYYVFKFFNYRRNFINQNIPNPQIENNRRQEEIETINRYSQTLENQREISNSTQTQIPENQGDGIKVFFHSSHNNKRQQFKIEADLSIKENLVKYVYQSLDINETTNNVVIIFRGKRVNPQDKVTSIEGIDSSSVIHLYVTVKIIDEQSNSTSGFNQSNSSNSGNNSINHNSNLNIVHFNTLKTHFILFLLFSIMLFSIKSNPNLVKGTTLLLFYGLFTLWWVQLCITLSKVIIFRKIDYSTVEE